MREERACGESDNVRADARPRDFAAFSNTSARLVFEPSSGDACHAAPTVSISDSLDRIRSSLAVGFDTGTRIKNGYKR